MKTFILILVCVLYSAQGMALENNLALSYAKDRSDCEQKFESVFICGSTLHQLEIIHLIQQARKYPIGEEIWQDIKNSGKRLLIAHSEGAVTFAGKSLAPMTSALSDGRGASAVILFNFEIPITGSHRVGGTQQEWTEFTKIQNFFHELVHARNYMAGVTQLYYLEEQVIETENIFRFQSTPLNLNLRSLDHAKGEQIWFPNTRR